MILHHLVNASMRNRIGVRVLARRDRLIQSLLRLIFAATCFAAFATASNATCPTFHTLANGTTADASHVMDNFNYILGCPNFTGNVGIGTANPTHTLEVVGSLNVSGAVTCGSGCGGGGGQSQWTTSGSNVYYNTGNVGIGTTNPATTLSISGNEYITGTLGIGIANPISGYPLTLYSSTASIGAKWETALSNGYVLANFTNPGGTAFFGLERSSGGGILAGDAANALVFVGSGTNPIQFGGNFSNNVFMTILGINGNVGIGTTSPSYRLHVNGTAYATGAAGALSDFRDKKDVAPLSTAALDAIGKLRAVTFLWKTPKDDGMKGRQTGLIAQEVEKVLPSTVLTANDARKSKAIKYDELTAILIKAVQEQQKEIKLQAGEIRKMRATNAKLEARLTRIERVRMTRAN